MLYNFSSLISEYGMIPNGNRVYFSKRSQPPLYIAMVDAYYEVLVYNGSESFERFGFNNMKFNFIYCLFQKTQDLMLVRELIDKMEMEFMFWIENRMTTVIVGDEEHRLAHYVSNVSYPRPGKVLINIDIEIVVQK